MFTVYCITSLVRNQVVYIGKTINFKKRVREHNCLTLTGCKLLNRAFKKHGKENFQFSTLRLVETNDIAIQLEKEFIILYNTKAPNGYNLTDGGEGTCGYSPNKATRLKMRNKKLGIKLASKHKNNISDALRNSARHKDAHNTPEFKLRMSKIKTNNTYWLGKKHKDSTKQLISKVHAKTFNIISPNGENLTITNMRQFCKDNNLNHVSMCKVCKGSQIQHKGWTI